MAACDEQAARVEYLTATVPQSLRHCMPQPKWDAMADRAKAATRDITQRDVAEYLALTVSAGADCRSNLAAVDKLLNRVEARAAAANKAQKK